MKTKMRWIAGAALLMMAMAGCEQTLIQPDAPASLNKNGPVLPDSGFGGGSSTLPPDTVNGDDTGYFGSGHYEPGPPPADTTKTHNQG